MKYIILGIIGTIFLINIIFIGLVVEFTERNDAKELGIDYKEYMR